MTRLRQLREIHSESQAQLAEVIGVHPATISGWESGTRQMDYSALVKIADHYHVSIDYILGRDLRNDSLSEDEAKLLRTYRDLSKNSRSLLCRIADIILEHDK